MVVVVVVDAAVVVVVVVMILMAFLCSEVVEAVDVPKQREEELLNWLPTSSLPTGKI